MKVWITGAGGLVGSTLKRVCREQRVDAISTHRETVDITSSQQIKKFLHTPEAAGITHILNCAAFTNVDHAEHHPEEAHRVNAIAPEHLGHIAHKNGLKIVHLSTDYVFGHDSSTPFAEHDPCQPTNVYAKTKLEGEQRLLDAYPQACILRTSWVFGNGGKNFISALVDKIQKDETLYVVNDQKNRATYATDLAQTILLLAGQSGIFHFANQGETSRFEIAHAMIQLVQERGIRVACREVIGVPASQFQQVAKRPLYSTLDTKKIENLIGISPRRWDVALKEFIDAI